MTCGRTLFSEQLDPSSSLLHVWLRNNGAIVCDGVEVRSSSSGGWGVFATRDIEVDELSKSLLLSTQWKSELMVYAVLAMPKTSILSARTTSLVLPPELLIARPDPDDIASSVQTNLTIPTLALVLLHEIRMGSQGKFWGYVQSLPRQVEGLPIFWAEDGVARSWLRGTEADRELERKDQAHMGLVS